MTKPLEDADSFWNKPASGAAAAPAVPSADDYWGPVQAPEAPKPGLVTRALDAGKRALDTLGDGRDPNERPPGQRRGSTWNNVKPFSTADERIVAPPPPAPGSSVLDRPAPAGTVVPQPQGLTPQEMTEGSVAPWKLEQDRAQADYLDQRRSPVAKPFDTAQNIAQDVREFTDNPVARGAVSGFSQLGKTGVGAVRIGADLVGAEDVAAFAGGASRAAETIGDGAVSDLKGNAQLVSAVTSSIMNSAPAVAVGMLGGPALTTLFAQSTLAEYNDGRDAGFDVGASAARAGIMGFAEALGERFGFPEQIKLLKGIARQMPPGEVAKVFGALLMKEIPGEQLTTAMQFLADKAGPAALRPNATVADYLEAAGETLKVTIGQTAVMGGGPAALMTGRDAARRADAAVERSAQTQAQRAAGDAGFIRPIERRKQAFSRFDDLAAEHGLSPKAAQAVKQAAERVPLAQLPGFLKRAAQSLSKRGLFGGQVDDAALTILDEPAPEVASRETDAAPIEAAELLGEADFSGLSEPAVQPEGGGDGLRRDDIGPLDGAGVADGGTVPGSADVVRGEQPGEGAAGLAGRPVPGAVSGGAAVPAGAEGGNDALTAEPAPAIAGEKINRSWTAFAPESGTLNLPREQLPQIKAEHRGALVNFLNARGIAHEAAEVPAESLKPTQGEFSPAKVKQAREFTGGDRAILVSSDGHVLDGHHQWLAKMESGEPVKVLRLDAPIADLLRLAHQFPSSTTARGPSRPGQADSTTRSNYGETAARDDQQPGVAGMARSQDALQQPPEQGLSEVRRARNQDVPGVGSQLRGVPGVGGAKAEPSAFAGSAGQQQGLRAGERPLGDGQGTSGESTYHRGGGSVRPQADGDRSGAGGLRRQDDLAEAPRKGDGARVGGEPATFDDDAQQHRSDLRGQDAKRERVGSGDGASKKDASSSPDGRLASGAGDENSGGARVIARVGKTPSTKDLLILRPNADGTLTPHLGKEPLLDYDSGQPIKIPGDATDLQAKKAIRDAGAISKAVNFFPPRGAKDAAAEAPPAKPEPSAPAQSTEAPASAAETGKPAAAPAQEASAPPKKTDRRAAAKARMALDVERDSMLQALAKLGGLDRQAAAREFGLKPEELKHTVSVGGLKGFPFRKTGGRGIDGAIEALQEAGYFPGVADEDVRGALEAAIFDELGGKAVLTPQGNMVRAEELARADEQARRERAEDPDFDPFDPGASEQALDPFTADELEESGYADASPEVKALTQQLLAEAEGLGIDTETLREDAARGIDSQTEDFYHARLQAAARQAIAQTGQDAQGGDARAAAGGNARDGQAARSQGQEGADQGLTVAPGSALTSDPVKRLGKLMQRAGWEIEYVDIDLIGANPKANIRIKRNDGRFIIAKVDAQGRASFESFQRDKRLGIDRMNPQARLAPQVDDQFLGRQKFEGARAMLRGMTNYVVDNALNPVSIEDMRAAWDPLLSGGAQVSAETPLLEAQTTADLKAKTEREGRAEELDARAQADAEREAFGLQQQTAPEQRKDNTGDMFGGPSVDDVRAATQRKKPSLGPSGPGLFDNLPAPASTPVSPREAMAAEEKAASGDPTEWAGRAAFKAGDKREAPPELSAANAPRWLKGFDDALSDEIERLSLESSRLLAEQRQMPDGDERERTIRRMDDADRRVRELQNMLPDEAEPEVEEAADDGPFVPADNWRESMYYARQYAKELGVEVAGKELPALVKAIDAKVGKPKTKPPAAQAKKEPSGGYVPPTPEEIEAGRIKQQQRDAERAAEVAAQQEALERGEFAESSEDDGGPWSDARTPMAKGDRRRYLIATPSGTVQVNLFFASYTGGRLAAELHGRSTSPTGYRSVLRLADDAATDPHGAAQRLVAEEQAKVAAEGTKDAKKAKVAKKKSAEPMPAKSPAAVERAPRSIAAQSGDSEAMRQAKADALKALGELSDILGAPGKANMMPEQEQKLVPVLTRLFDAAFRMGYLKFKESARFVLDQIRDALGAEVAEKITIDHLQGAYIGMAGRYKDQGAERPAAVAAVDSIDQLEADPTDPDNPDGGPSHVPDADTSVERDRRDAGAQVGEVETAVRDGAGRAAAGAVDAGGRTREEGRRRASDPVVPADRAAAAGERSDQSLRGGARVAEPSLVPAGADIDQRGGGFGDRGVPVETVAADLFAGTAETGLRDGVKRAAQRKADATPVKPGDLENVRATLPYLLPGQQEDVAKAEKRFAEPEGYGMLFTNGTGTGKTFTGLGTVKRFARQGKTNILIVAPSDKIISDWIESAKALGLSVTQLADVNDAGSGIVITTYANFGQNRAIGARDWDLVVADEAHYLAQDKDGTTTNALKTLRAVTLNPDGDHTLATMKHASLYDQFSAAHDAVRDAMKAEVAPDVIARLQRTADAFTQKWEAKREEVKAHVAAHQGTKRPRALFLSATPFAYEKSIDWAEGYLFDYAEGKDKDNTGARYNSGDNRDQFFLQHFGYRMRYNKLTQPDSKVDSGLMQRQFNGWLKRRGALAGRMLDVEADYDRRFVLVDSAIGVKIDEALQWLWDNSKNDRGMGRVRDLIDKKFDYLSRRYLLEAIKASEVIPHVREHLALGRKVVVFHDYKKGGGFNPFALSGVPNEEGAPAAYERFAAKFGDLIAEPFHRMRSPIEAFTKAFPDVLLFNGDVPSKQRRDNVAKFQSDDTGPQVILVQSAAGKEGISLHDTTGKHQRVLFNLGQPTQPTTAIQQEGRIYRTGQVSDALFRYLNTGTNWEKWAFATTIAQRASAAENLGMGELARALKDAFVTGFEESGNYRAGDPDEGKGGKERDRAANEAISEYDRARAFYWGTQKKDSRTKAREGKDYFATPEPVGLKMVQWADVRGGEDVLEPSGGHGAIARWFPETAERTMIEPSNELVARAALVFDGKIITGDFENHHVVNKYDAIVMNPPFGTAGRTAVDHIAKAATHLRDGGRIVALLPRGSTDAKFDKWFHGEETRKAEPMGHTERVGDYYDGDMVELEGQPGRYRIEGRAQGATGTLMFRRVDGSGSIPLGFRSHYIARIVASGPRTETYKPAEHLYLVADVNLPAVTFERAGTAVATRILVIEKQTDAANAPAHNRSRDYSDITDINELFDRLEDVEMPRRLKPEAEEAEAEPAKPTAQQRYDAKVGAKAAAAAEGAKVAADTGMKVVEVTTSSGKVLRGVLRPDLTLGQAKAIDPFTWRPKGHDGFFIREKHLAALAKAHPPAAGAPETNGPPSGVAMFSIAVNTTAEKERKLSRADLADPAQTSKPATYAPDPDPANQRIVAAIAKGLGRPAEYTLSAVTGPDLPARLRAARALARGIWGHKVVFVQQRGGRLFNGLALDSPGADFVLLDVDTDKPVMAVLGHELLHRLRAARPDIYDGLNARLEPLIRDQILYNIRLSDKRERVELIALTDEQLREELIADIVGDEFTNPQFWRDMARSDRSWFRRLAEFVMGFLDDVISKVTKARPFGTEEYLSDLKAARAAVVDAMAKFAQGESDTTVDVAGDIKFAAAATAGNTRTTIKKQGSQWHAEVVLDGKTVADTFQTEAEAQRWADEKAGRAPAPATLRPSSAPLDKVLQLAGGNLLSRLTSPSYDWLLNTLDDAGRAIGGKPYLYAKAGLVADYGLTPDYRQARQDMATGIRRGTRAAATLIEQLQGLDRAQSRIAYLWMQEKPDAAMEQQLLAQLPEESRASLLALKDRIDELGRQAVELGLLSQETYERNAMAYLHRSYKKYEIDNGAAKVARAKAVKILGDQFKGRGLRDDAGMEAIGSPDWWARQSRQGRADTSLKGQRFHRLELRAQPDTQTAPLFAGGAGPARLGKLRKVVYWPAGEAIPTEYADWRNDGQWEARFFDKSGKVGMWRDFTLAERTAMGEIQEVRYSAAKTMLQATKDIEVARLLDWVARNESVMAEDAVPEGHEVVKASDSMARAYLDTEWVQVPTASIPGTAGVKRYGNLAGRYVPGPVWNDLRQLQQLTEQGNVAQMYAGMLKAWKIAKTSLSPSTHTNNILSNFILADAHDIQARHVFRAASAWFNHADRPKLGRKADPAAKKLIEDYQDNGGDGGKFNEGELREDVMAELLAQLEQDIQRQPAATALVSAAQVLDLMRAREFRQAFAAIGATKTVGMAGKPFRSLIKLYGHEDELFRLAAFIKARDDGLNDHDAGKFARESFLDYNINAPWIQAMRRTAFPFIAFTYRAVPMLLRAAADKPHKFAKYLMVAGALNALAYGMLGDDGDEDKERALMPEEKAGNIWGIFPKLMRMPWNDKHGSPVFLDVRRWVPAGDVIDTNANHSAVPVPAPLMPGGPLVIAAEVILNKQSFTGKDITLDTDTLAEKWGKFGSYMWKSAMPNFPGLPGTYATDALVNAGSGKLDAFGRERGLGQAALSTVGVKVASYPRDAQLRNAAMDLRAKVAEIRRGLAQDARQLARKGMTQEEFDKRAQAAVTKIQELTAEMNEKVQRAEATP